MHCIKCGEELNINDNFCSKCGFRSKENKKERLKLEREKQLKAKQQEKEKLDIEKLKEEEQKKYEKERIKQEKAEQKRLKKEAKIEQKKAKMLEMQQITQLSNNANYTKNNYYATKIKKTIIVASDNRKKATSAVGRAVVGGVLLGPAGLLAGVSAKSKNSTTFQIIYSDGTQKTETVANDSYAFKEYCKYLD